MKGLTEESIAQIDNPEKLRFLLSGVVQKNTKQLKRIKVLQKQLKKSRNENKELSTSMKEMKITVQDNQIYHTEYELEKIRAQFNEFAFTSLFEIVQNLKIDNLESLLNEMKNCMEKFKVKQDEQINCFKKLLQDKENEIEQLNKKIDELKETIDKLESSPISKDVEDLLNEKDQSIVKLRSLIQRYAKSDQIKQQQIDEQQRQIQQFIDSYSNRESSLKQSNNDSVKIAKLEKQIIELQSQIDLNSSNHEAEAKTDKLTALLEKSNMLYYQLNEKYLALKESTRKDKKLTAQTTLLFEVLTKGKIKKQQNKKGVNTESAIVVSLRKTLLQYFLTELENQESLIPVILEIVGCNKDQIEGAVRNHKINHHIINRAGSFFGLFS